MKYLNFLKAIAKALANRVAELASTKEGLIKILFFAVGVIVGGWFF